MAASNEQHDRVEVLDPPQDALPGDTVTVHGYDQGAPDASVNASKAKFYPLILKDLLTDDQGVATYKGVPLCVQRTGETCTVKSLQNAHIA